MINYLTLEEARQIHFKTIEKSGGGTHGELELGKLDSVLEHIQNDLYYPNFEDKLTHLFFGACQFHCFQDGNKRIAITLSTHMLLTNGYMGCAKNFMIKMENISYYVAAGKINKDLLHEIITAVIYEEDESEELKLKILNAMQADDEN